jgi:acyl-CoA synthetase (AMP-forming)/AMP-acid ligase II
MDAPFIVATMARRGLITPAPPARVYRQLASLFQWGFGLAGEVRQAAMRDPGRVAVIDEQGPRTYGELLDRSSRLALALPVKAGDRVGVLCRNSAAMIETLVAATIVGADPVMINTGLSGAQLAKVTADQELKVIVHDEEFAGLLPDFSEIGIPVGLLDKMIADVPAGTKLRPPERPGRTIVLTSGTTGVPKGARRPTPGGFGPLCSIIDRIPLRAGTRVMIAAPLFHTWGFAGLQIALALRATIVLRRRFDPAAVLDMMTREACTALIAVPVMLQNIMEVADGARPPVSVVAVSGSALPGGLATRFMDRYGEVLYNLYGSTEASWVSIATPADLRFAPDTAGRPPHGTAVAVLDEAGRPVPQGTTGRLFAGNEMLFEGYTNGTGREMRDGMIATGDVGHLDEGGRIYVDGREDDMIVSGGENVFPAEVEGLLADLAGVREVAVIGVPDDEFGQRLAAFVVLQADSALDADAVREHVRQHRARFCVPRDVVFLTELPRNATGKVLKRELPR